MFKCTLACSRATASADRKQLKCQSGPEFSSGASCICKIIVIRLYGHPGREWWHLKKIDAEENEQIILQGLLSFSRKSTVARSSLTQNIAEALDYISNKKDLFISKCLISKGYSFLCLHRKATQGQGMLWYIMFS